MPAAPARLRVSVRPAKTRTREVNAPLAAVVVWCATAKLFHAE
jgi:hypothetical protein